MSKKILLVFAAVSFTKPVKPLKLLLTLMVVVSGAGGCELIPDHQPQYITIGQKNFPLRQLQEEEAKFLQIINEYRRSQTPPLPALTSSATINEAAYNYSVYMAQTGWFDHVDREGRSPWDRMCEAGHMPACDGSATMGENIAYGSRTAQEVFEGWKASAGHNANMLAPEFVAIGIGLADIEGAELPYVWTTDFSSVLDVDGCSCYEGDQRECETENCGPGIQSCEGLCQWGQCIPPNQGVEICDGYDNDCDGQIDEDDVCHGCIPSKEICDDKDNDCDGLIDEEGVCGNECIPSEEVCDGNDNDCDGTVDEGCFCPEGSSDRECGFDVGICTKGKQSCESGAWSECRGGIQPRVEICDGYDNDCDGAIDERVCEQSPPPEDGEDSGDGTQGCGCQLITQPQGGMGRAILFPIILCLTLLMIISNKNGRRLLYLLLLISFVTITCMCQKSTPPSTSDTNIDSRNQTTQDRIDGDLPQEIQPDLTEPTSETPEGLREEDSFQNLEIHPQDTPLEELTHQEEPVEKLSFGSPCSSDDQCESSICLPTSLGGTCSVRCTKEAICSSYRLYSCTVYGRDTNDNGLTDEVVQACAPRAEDSKRQGRSCSSPQQCRSRICIEGGICMYVCETDADCPAAARCLWHSFPLDEGSGSYLACGFNSVSTLTLHSAEYGNVSMVTDAPGGRRREILIPSDAVSLTITMMQTSPSLPTIIGFYRVYDPADILIYDMPDYYDGSDPPNWHIPWIRMGIFMVPIAPRVEIIGGSYEWMAVAAKFSQADPTVTVDSAVTYQIKRSPTGDITSGSLDVNFFFVGLDSIDASSAQVPGSEFQQVVDWLSSIYLEAGISIGNITYNDITGSDRARYRILHIDYSDPDLGEVGGLLRLTAGRGEFAVNVFLVHDIDESGVLGLSPGIPGPQGIHGTAASGVIINYDSMWSPRSAGMVIAHEIGHYLGLFHSTEQSSNPYPGDPIHDTAHGDTSNLMHWQWGGDQLTEGQGFVMRRAALVY